MVQKTPLSWGTLATSFLLLSIFLGIYSDVSSSDTETEGNFESQNRSQIKIVEDVTGDGHEFHYTKSFRPKDDMYGGAIIGKDNRKLVVDPQSESHKVHGQLIMNFRGKEYIGTGTLVSPFHVLTAGHNIYDPCLNLEDKWAHNIRFILAGCDEEVRAVKKIIFHGWKEPITNPLTHKKECNQDYDIGVISLAQPIGLNIGWNGMMYLDDDLLSSLKFVTVSGYPGDKTSGTMWEDKSPISAIKNKLFDYKLSTSGGQSGSNPWIKLSNPLGYYSLGTHASGTSIKENDKEIGIHNTATRLTKSKLKALVNRINEDL